MDRRINAKAMTFNDGLLTFNQEIAKQIADRKGTRKFSVLFSPVIQ